MATAQMSMLAHSASCNFTSSMQSRYGALFGQKSGAAGVRSRQPAQPAALLANVLERFKPARRSIMKIARAELLELVKEGSADFDRASALVDTLLGSQLPFREQLIGGGPWQVVYSRGPLLWQGFKAAGNALSAKRLARSANKASQEYDPTTRQVINRGEILGEQLFVTAEGTYAPEGQAETTPVLVKATVERGALHAWGREFALPIRGSGFVQVMYLDADVRVLQNLASAVTVQVRQDLLQQLLSA